MQVLRKMVFQVEGYGENSVYENTVAAVADAGLTLGTALECDDVDTPDDLRKLVERISPDTHTGIYLNQLRKEILGQ